MSARPPAQLMNATATSSDRPRILFERDDTSADLHSARIGKWPSPAGFSTHHYWDTERIRDYEQLQSLHAAITILYTTFERNESTTCIDEITRPLQVSLRPVRTQEVSTRQRVSEVLDSLTSRELRQSIDLFPIYSQAADTLLDTEELKKIGEQVRHLLEIAGEDNWDGEGAQALDPETAKIANEMAAQLPAGIGEPDVTATPQGEVDFDWIVSSTNMMTISACPTQEVAFAAMFENARARDRIGWDGRFPVLLSACLDMLKAAFSEKSIER